MGIERSPARQKRDAKRREAVRKSQTVGGSVVVRRIGDPVPDEPPPMPSDPKEIRRVARITR